jgi:hypothetical protein
MAIPKRITTDRMLASLSNVWSCASSLGLRARGGRTVLQKVESKDKPPTTFVMHVCPSHSRFQPISADIERSRKPSKEARFRALKAVARVRIPGYQGKPPLTRPGTTTQPASISSNRPSGTREGRAQEPPARTAFGTANRSADFACPTSAHCWRTCAVARWTSSGTARPIGAPQRRLDDQASLQAEGLRDTSVFRLSGRTAALYIAKRGRAPSRSDAPSDG